MNWLIRQIARVTLIGKEDDGDELPQHERDYKGYD